MTTLGPALVKIVTISDICHKAISTVLSRIAREGADAGTAGGETYTAAVSPLTYQSIGDIQIGLAGCGGLNRFGRLELLVETTLVLTL